MDIIPTLLETKQESNIIQDELMEDLHDRRIILVNGDISDWLFEYCSLHIMNWNLQDKHIPIEERTPIKLYIDSDGGSPMISNNIINIIECSKTPVHGIVFSSAASAACLLLIGCHKRYAFKHSTVLIHDGSLGIQQTARKAKDTMKFFDKIDEITKDLILSRTNINEEEYEDNKDREQYFFGHECLEKGIVDHIIGENGITLEDIM